jgi:hypothetical protein
MRLTVESAYTLWLAADDAWQDELERVYGGNAGDARYDERGTATDRLADLYDAFKAAENRYRSALIVRGQ